MGTTEVGREPTDLVLAAWLWLNWGEFNRLA